MTTPNNSPNTLDFIMVSLDKLNAARLERTEKQAGIGSILRSLQGLAGRASASAVRSTGSAINRGVSNIYNRAPIATSLGGMGLAGAGILGGGQLLQDNFPDREIDPHISPVLRPTDLPQHEPQPQPVAVGAPSPPSTPSKPTGINQTLPAPEELSAPGTSEPSGMQNWHKALLAGGAGLASGAAAHFLTGDEDDEEGNPRKRMPWLGPAVGLGVGGALAGHLADWDHNNLMSEKWWKQSSAKNIPLVLIPWQVKFAQPGIPPLPNQIPPITAPSTPPVTPPMHPTPPTPNIPPLMEDPHGFNQPAPRAEPVHQGVTGGMQFNMMNPHLGDPTAPSPMRAAPPMGFNSQTPFNPMGTSGMGAHPGAGTFSSSSQLNQLGSFNSPASRTPPVTANNTNPEFRPQDTQTAGAAPPSTPGAEEAHPAIQHVADRALEHHPELRDPAALQQAGIQNMQSQTPPSMWGQLMSFWNSLPLMQKILLGAGLSLGAIGLLGMLTGSESLGGSTGALLGLGGLGAAAYGAGAFDPDSRLRTSIGRWMGGGDRNPAIRNVEHGASTVAPHIAGMMGRPQAATNALPGAVGSLFNQYAAPHLSQAHTMMNSPIGQLSSFLQ